MRKLIVVQQYGRQWFEFYLMFYCHLSVYMIVNIIVWICSWRTSTLFPLKYSTVLCITNTWYYILSFDIQREGIGSGVYTPYFVALTVDLRQFSCYLHPISPRRRRFSDSCSVKNIVIAIHSKDHPSSGRYPLHFSRDVLPLNLNSY